jgi:alpha/beta superfamily hydrolase
VEAVRFQAGPYHLEGELAYPEAVPPTGSVVIAGPHPLLGGDMNNNVVRGLGDGLAARGVATLRFNYRGVGGSEGPPVDVACHLAEFWQTSHVPEEQQFHADLAAAIAFTRKSVGTAVPLAVIGYSFGCALVPRTAPLATLRAIVLIAPTLARHDYSHFKSVRCPTLVLASDDDFTCTSDLLAGWFDQLAAPRQLIRRNCDNHFFRGHEPWLVETVFPFLQRHMEVGRHGDHL